MRVPVAGILLNHGSNWKSPSNPKGHDAYGFLARTSFMTNVVDPSSHFWDTDHREYNDCVHSKRVGFSTGHSIIPDMVGPNGKVVRQEDGSYDPSLTYPSYLYRDSGEESHAWGCSFVSVGSTYTYFTVHAYFVTGGTANKLKYRHGKCVVRYRFTERGKPYTSIFVETDRYGFRDELIAATAPLMAGKLCYPVGRKAWDLDVQYSIEADWHRIGYDVCVSFCKWLQTRYRLGITPIPSEGSGTIVPLAYRNPPPPFAPHFIFHEDDIVEQGIDPYLVAAGKDLSNYWRNVLIQQAYLDALQSVPRLNDNSISNVIEIAGFIKSLVVEHRIEMPKRLNDAWLSYRYQYSTSKLDAEEAIQFVRRHADVSSFSQGISCYGSSRFIYRDTAVTCRCGVVVRPREVNTLDRIWRALYTYGLQPDFYVVWDMIPYSFIVDWLIPVGTLASVADARRMYDSTYYDITKCIFSLSYDVEDDGCWYHQYTRWSQGSPPELNGFYFFETADPSKKTVGYRILDSLSLVIK